MSLLKRNKLPFPRRMTDSKIQLRNRSNIENSSVFVSNGSGKKSTGNMCSFRQAVSKVKLHKGRLIFRLPTTCLVALFLFCFKKHSIFNLRSLICIPYVPDAYRGWNRSWNIRNYSCRQLKGAPLDGRDQTWVLCESRQCSWYLTLETSLQLLLQFPVGGCLGDPI